MPSCPISTRDASLTRQQRRVIALDGKTIRGARTGPTVRRRTLSPHSTTVRVLRSGRWQSWEPVWMTMNSGVFVARQLLTGIQGDHVGVGVPALMVRMLRPDPPGGMVMMRGCSRAMLLWVRFGDPRGAGGPWRGDRPAQWRFRASRPTPHDPFPARVVVDHPGASWSPEHPMIVVRTVEWAEQALGVGEIGCPHSGCGGILTPWGYGRRRRVRSLGAQTLEVRPRRARCTRCAGTQILLPATMQPALPIPLK